MELSRKAKKYWGLDVKSKPFSTHIEDQFSPFIWDGFQSVINRIAKAVKRRQFLCVVGPACSAKSTAWAMAKSQLVNEGIDANICQPRGIDPRRYQEQTIYFAVKNGIDPDSKLKRGIEDRALQCRALLETQNMRDTPVVLCINDAHLCQREFLLNCKRIWDDVCGFDRLLCVLLIGQPGLEKTIANCREINERAEIIKMPGLQKRTAGKVNSSDQGIELYIQHEWARCEGINQKPLPLTDGACEVLKTLAKHDYKATQDHPLVVNNIMASALELGYKANNEFIDSDTIRRAMMPGK